MRTAAWNHGYQTAADDCRKAAHPTNQPKKFQKRGLDDASLTGYAAACAKTSIYYMCKPTPVTLNTEKLNFIAAFTLYGRNCSAPFSATKFAREIYTDFLKQTNTGEKYLAPAIESGLRDIRKYGRDEWCGAMASKLYIE